MNAKLTEKRQITLVGMDFFGNPYEKAGGWSEQNAIGLLWQRFQHFSQTHQGAIKHQVSEAGYEVWIDLEEDADKQEPKHEYIFVGVEVAQLDELPLPLVAKVLPETRYAVFTVRGQQITSDWPDALWNQWLPEAGLYQAYPYLIEYYDTQRFHGMEHPDSELDLYVPIV